MNLNADTVEIQEDNLIQLFEESDSSNTSD